MDLKVANAQFHYSFLCVVAHRVISQRHSGLAARESSVLAAGWFGEDEIVAVDPGQAL